MVISYTLTISGSLRGAWRGDPGCERFANRFFAETTTVRDVGAAMGNCSRSQRSEAASATKAVNEKKQRITRCSTQPVPVVRSSSTCER
jgi:hypothetical protein